MRRARGAALVIFERDPQLEHPENRRYRFLLERTRELSLSQVS
jgi:hypothetical protein